MIKTIQVQKPTQMTIIKDGEIVANIYVPGINGSIDTDVIKVWSCDNPCGEYHVKLEV